VFQSFQFNVFFSGFTDKNKQQKQVQTHLSFNTTLLLCLWYFSSFYSAIILLGGSSIPHMNTVDSPLGYMACFLNLSFDVLSVICKLHNLWSPFKIPFYLVLPIVYSFRAHAFFTWRPYAAFYEIALTCHIEGSMQIAIWTYLRIFQNCTSSC
jgi:hypothetical protein